MDELGKLNKPIFILAPMDDVTDSVFRQIVADCAAPDLFFTEFVNVDGLQSPGRPNLLRKVQFTAKEKPLIAQIWGLNPENYYKTTKELKEMGFAGVDINMGCPVKTVIKNGACVALINNRGLAGEIIAATKEAAGDDFPVSVKTRLGFKEIDYSWPEFLLQQKLNMLTVHGRTAKQMSKNDADWSAIGKVREIRDKVSPTTLLIGNGDVMSREQGQELAKQYKLDGVMIGRGIFHDPFVFAKKSSWPTLTKQEKINLYKKHVELFAKTWSFSNRRIQVLNKFCKIYINDFPEAKELRTKLMNASSADDLIKLLETA